MSLANILLKDNVFKSLESIKYAVNRSLYLIAPLQYQDSKGVATSLKHLWNYVLYTPLTNLSKEFVRTEYKEKASALIVILTLKWLWGDMPRCSQPHCNNFATRACGGIKYCPHHQPSSMESSAIYPVLLTAALLEKYTQADLSPFLPKEEEHSCEFDDAFDDFFNDGPDPSQTAATTPLLTDRVTEVNKEVFLADRMGVIVGFRNNLDAKLQESLEEGSGQPPPKFRKTQGRNGVPGVCRQRGRGGHAHAPSRPRRDRFVVRVEHVHPVVGAAGRERGRAI